MIPKRSVAGFIDRHRPELSRRKISFFELNAAMAFEYFARARVDIAVIETGLGGRLDATNVLKPRLTITTDISRDHVEILGSSLSKIAWEKAGIIKSGVPHVIGHLPPPAQKVMRDVCKQRRARLHRLCKSHYTTRPERAEISFDDGHLKCQKLKMSLWGEHQLRNAATVLEAVSTLQQGGLRITKGAIRKGFAATDWPGRFQVIEKKGHPTIVLDVGHNERGVATMVDAFRLRFPNRKATVITGFVKRKQHQAMLDSLSSIASEFWLVPLASHRSADVDELIAELDFCGCPVRRFSSLSASQRNLAKTAQPDDIVIIAGSHYLVGEYLEKFSPR
jgi:dihydrofolate synthase/folylpolyglutamate synthase